MRVVGLEKIALIGRSAVGYRVVEIVGCMVVAAVRVGEVEIDNLAYAEAYASRAIPYAS